MLEKFSSLQNLPSFISPTGGLHYHFKAWRYRVSLWHPFREKLHQQLNNWSSVARARNASAMNELVIIGTSGGYTLPTEWLCGFSKVIAYDVDPLAPLFFKKVHESVNVHWRWQDAFFTRNKISGRKATRTLSASPITHILRGHFNSMILFSNVLGQLPLMHPVTENEMKLFGEGLCQALHGLNWASYHDLYSVEPLPLKLHPSELGEFKSLNEFSGLIQQQAPGRTLSVFDHMTENLLPTRGVNLPWSLTPKNFHVVEFTSSLANRQIANSIV